jgi:hypothetical protein
MHKALFCDDLSSSVSPQCAVADPGGFLGFLGFRGTPLFVVLCACVASLVRVHEAGENVLDCGTPLSKSYIRHWCVKRNACYRKPRTYSPHDAHLISKAVFRDDFSCSLMEVYHCIIHDPCVDNNAKPQMHTPHDKAFTSQLHKHDVFLENNQYMPLSLVHRPLFVTRVVMLCYISTRRKYTMLYICMMGFPAPLFLSLVMHEHTNHARNNYYKLITYK